MSWSNQGGNGGQGGPWGGRGSGGPQPPDIEDLLRQGQDRFRSMFPGGSRRGLVLALFVVIGIWLASGFYRVLPDEQGVVLRFGEWILPTKPPGLHYHLPYPVEQAMTPKVTRVNRIEVGFRSAVDSRNSGILREVFEESLMLTGDENIVSVNFTVFWVINDAGKFLFNIRNPVETVKAAAESAMREIVGQKPIARAFAEGRQQIEQEAHALLQGILDSYESGIHITQVQLQKVDPPGEVIDSFRDVQRARADLERKRNEAETYRNDIIPRARGAAEAKVQEAEGYRQEIIARAQGDASRFLAVYEEYRKAKKVTEQRLYLETMEEIFSNAEKVIIDSGASGGQGVVPYLPLPEVQKRMKGNSGKGAAE
ncbi:MAG: FtsH protease activity modulator HflK [Rhodospirillaceae bacterium]|nr:MAG: FtsH protease activity modulator HflK [Rhodospirillaceae bacterium]